MIPCLAAIPGLQIRVRRVAAAFLLATLNSFAMSQDAVPTSTADGAAAAAQDLYARISARDKQVLRYIPEGGFSEFNSGSELHQLDARAFEKLFASPLAIDLHAEGVRAERFGDVALVTGTRVGSLTPPGETPKSIRHAFSMVWTLSERQWRLRHVHLSAMP